MGLGSLSMFSHTQQLGAGVKGEAWHAYVIALGCVLQASRYQAGQWRLIPVSAFS